MGKYIALYITKKDYACHHCGKLPPFYEPDYPSIIHEILFDRFKQIRDSWGKPLHIDSGYRCQEHNKAVGGEEWSVHCFGLALDLGVDNEEEVHQLVHVAETIDPDLRIGFQRYLDKGQHLVHIDVGYLINPRFSLNLHEGARW
jgi:uncharacterized protein YcbK (DUF882 family)